MKNKIEKYLIIILMIFIIVIPSKSNAEEKEKFNPVIDNSSFIVTNDNVTVGDTIKIEVKITSNTVNLLNSVGIRFTKPVTFADTDLYILKYNSVTGKYECTIAIDNTWQNGEYLISYMYLNDGTDSVIRYNSKNSHSLNYNGIDLSGCHFEVYGTTADDIIPEIDGATLEISNRKVMIGDIIKYSIKITDNSVINRAYIKLEHKENSNYIFKEIELKYNYSTQLYEGTLIVDGSIERGLWEIYYICAGDINSNYAYLYNNRSFGTNKSYNWSTSVYSIYNYQNDSDSKVTENSIFVEKKAITKGDKNTISLEAMNYFGIDNIKIYYKNEENEGLQTVEALFKKRNSTEGNNGIEYYFDEYVAELEFGEYGYNGKWLIDKIEITSIRNKVTTIYNSKMNQNGIDLTNGEFETYGLIEDSTPPTITNYELSNSNILYKNNTILSITASDDLSGVQNVIVNYLLPDGTLNDYYLDNVDNTYIYYFNYDDQEKAGNYSINYILVTDKAGNIYKIDKNLSKLNFTFISQINIISPSKYLDTYTSYSLKTLIYQENKTITDVIWSSSNTSIASINSITGVLSTKGVNGKVIITATANDGSGMYGKIELIVSNVAVKIGDVTTIESSNWTRYSSVTWKVEDESILKLTGQNGYVAINSSYKHNVQVKGIKEGVTYLKMCVPSGDVVVSYPVYVYSSIVSITTDTNELLMKKNEEKKINAKILLNNSETTSKIALYYMSENEKIAKVDQNGMVTALGGGRTNIKVYSQYDNISITIPVRVITIEYSTHVQRIGWQDYVNDGKMSGTEGQGLRLEGIKIKVASDIVGGITYSTHVQNEGWQEWKSNDAVSGTMGKSLRLEAIKIKLTGEMANKYDVYYRVHAQEFGWLDWAKNGAEAGTAGYSYRLEGIQIKLVAKGGSAPGTTTRAFVQSPVRVVYTTHVQNEGWQKEVRDGVTSGTVGKGLRLEGIRMNLENTGLNGLTGGISYRTHIQNIGWQDWKENNTMSGTSGKSLRLEAIQIKLTGKVAEEYDVYYRVQAQNFGWLGWAKNGASAGTSGYSYRLEAIQIKLVKKGGAAPGSTANAFKSK